MKKIISKCLIMIFIISVGGNFAAKATTLSYTPVTPCKIVDTRNTSAGMIGASTERDFHVFGDGSTIGNQGGNSAGCPAPMGEPLAAHINMVAVNPTGKGNLKAFPQGVGATTGLSVNYNNIDTNLANAGTVMTTTGAGTDITVASNFSSAHVTMQVLGYYYPINFAAVPETSAGEGNGVPWPDPRFTDNGDGTVTDNLTGLIWLKDPNCFPATDISGALEASNELAQGQCGLSDGSISGDWRLPNIKELLSMIDYGGCLYTGPDECHAIRLPPGHPFSAGSSCYITSTFKLKTNETGLGEVCDDPGTTCEWFQVAVANAQCNDITAGVWPVRGGND